MESFSGLLIFVGGIHQWPVNSPHKRPVRRGFDIFLVLDLNKRLETVAVVYEVWSHQTATSALLAIVLSIKRFSHHWAFVGGIHCSAAEQTVESPVSLVMTALCNGQWTNVYTEFAVLSGVFLEGCQGRFTSRKHVTMHDDVMKLNIFRVAGPLWRKFTGYRWIPLTKASDAELWCFLSSAPEQLVEQTIETPVIWNVIVLILTSL